MQGLIMAAQLLLGLSILVVLHEFGHFITARMFGIKVEKFYLFFDAWGVKLLKFKYKDTEYGIGWLPFGGYVKISGMIDESMDVEQMKEPAQPWEFRSKPAWQRLIVMLGGVIFNVILGILIFSLMLNHYNKEYLPVSEVNKTGIYAYGLARDIGFQTGDKIVSIDGEKVVRFADAVSTKVLFGGEYEVERNGEIVTIDLPGSFYNTFKSNMSWFIDASNHQFVVDSVIDGMSADQGRLKKGDKIVFVDQDSITSFGKFREVLADKKSTEAVFIVQRNGTTDSLSINVDSTGRVGFVAEATPYDYEDYTFGSSIRFGANDAFEVVTTTLKGLGKIFAGEENASESIAGPIGIAKIYGGVWNWQKFWFITGLLSMVLAIMNILPIPALDGGHVLIIVIETIIGRKIPDKAMEIIQIAGIIIVLSLMVFAVGNDIFRHFIK